jgi:hypothetical protein
VSKQTKYSLREAESEKHCGPVARKYGSFGVEANEIFRMNRNGNSRYMKSDTEADKTRRIHTATRSKPWPCSGGMAPVLLNFQHHMELSCERDA